MTERTPLHQSLWAFATLFGFAAFVSGVVSIWTDEPLSERFLYSALLTGGVAVFLMALGLIVLWYVRQQEREFYDRVGPVYMSELEDLDGEDPDESLDDPNRERRR